MADNNYIALKKSDWIIILVLVLLPLLIKAIYAFVPTKDVYYQIKHYCDNSEIIENIESDDFTKFLTVQGKSGNLIIEFDKEKGVRVASSTCPCQVCVNSGWSKNEALVCVPNAVIIQTIKKREQLSNKVDAVTR